MFVWPLESETFSYASELTGEHRRIPTTVVNQKDPLNVMSQTVLKWHNQEH